MRSPRTALEPRRESRGSKNSGASPWLRAAAFRHRSLMRRARSVRSSLFDDELVTFARLQTTRHCSRPLRSSNVSSGLSAHDHFRRDTGRAVSSPVFAVTRPIRNGFTRSASSGWILRNESIDVAERFFRAPDREPCVAKIRRYTSPLPYRMTARRKFHSPARAARGDGGHAVHGDRGPANCRPARRSSRTGHVGFERGHDPAARRCRGAAPPRRPP